METNHIPLSERPIIEQPDIKLKKFGAEILTDAELLAIILRTGVKGRSAIDISHQILLYAHHSLHRLASIQPRELEQIKGVGKSKSLIIAAAMELAKRKQLSHPLERKKITSSKEIADFLKIKVGDLGYEVFGVVYLNRANRIITYELISKGGITGTVADTRIILKNAIMQGATGIILYHNHPSGNLQASQADIILTKKIISAAEFMDIKVLDHLIISHEGYMSLLDEGLIA